MDANQQRFWLLANKDDWPGIDANREAEYDRECRRLRLRDKPNERTLAGQIDTVAADTVESLPAMARDRFGTYAYWDADAGMLLAQGALGLDAYPVILFKPDAGEVVTDLAMGYDDVLYLATQQPDGIRLVDRRDRWKDPVKISLADFTPDRLAADPAGGVWALDRTRGKVARLQGLPLPDGQPGEFLPTTFRPVPENPNPPQLKEDASQPALIVGAENPVSLACSPAGQLALLTRRGTDQAWLHVRDQGGRWQAPRQLAGVGRCLSVTWLSATRIGVMPAPRAANLGERVPPREIPAFDPDDETQVLQAVGAIYPFVDGQPWPFLQGAALPPHYPTGVARSRPAVALSAEHFALDGTATGRVLDAGREGATWHRLYVEAELPPRCGLVISLSASDNPSPDPASQTWHEHHFGATPRWGEADQKEFSRGPASWFGPARGVWLPDRSEIPHHAGLLGETPEQDRAGLFTALVQRAGRRVRALLGRYLSVRVRLLGTGNRSPELAALRVYASRFSYRDHYLPELYREELFGQDANRRGRATPADFLDRFLGLFESFLTPLEDRVAAAHVLMDPRSTPDDALEWLGSWMGVVFDPAFPAERRRAWLRAAPRLYRTRGTLTGLQLALEIATGGKLVREFHSAAEWGLPVDGGGREGEFPKGGAVTAGRVLVIEEFRLRRTFATILGANLSEPEDPLLPGLLFSSNSYVGDTLILGDEEKKEFLALFRDAFSTDPAQRQAEEAAVYSLYQRLADRVAVLVQNTVSPADFGLIRRIAQREAPAHVVLDVVQASRKLIVGLSSLIEVDTYLASAGPPGAAQLDNSRLGENDFIRRLPSLDPRTGGGGGDVPRLFPRPKAVVQGPESAELGDDIELSGADSKAAAGRTLEDFLWTPLPPGS